MNRTGRRAAFALLIFGATLAAGAARAAAWDAGGGDKWAAMLAAARQEGGLTVAMCPDLTGPIERDFRADTGLDISFIAGGTVDINNRFKAEVRTGRETIDAHFGGASDVRLAKEGKLAPLGDALVLPNVTNLSNWRNGHLEWVDNDGRYVVVAAQYVSTVPMVNKDIVDPAALSKWTDLLKPEFKGKIAAFDPTVGGPGQSVAAYMASLHGIDFVTKVYKGQQVVLTRNSRQLGEWAARGLYPIVLGIDPLQLPIFNEAGITSLVFVHPKDGPGSLLGGCSAMSIPKDAPHPNSARVLANWYLSSRGQAALVEASHLPTRRVDVPLKGVPDYFIPDPKRTYLSQYREDWYLKERPVVRKALKAALDK